MKYSIYIIALVTLFSCNKPSELQKELGCKTKYDFGQMITSQDFQKKFTVQIPKNWSTKYFYNEFQTSLMTADSLKSLSNSFILDISLNNGELKVDDQIKGKVIRNIITKEHLRIKNFKISEFHKKPSVWFVAEGTRNELPYHLFRILIKNSPTTYFQIETQIYGDSLVNERLCKSISIIETIQTIK